MRRIAETCLTLAAFGLTVTNAFGQGMAPRRPAPAQVPAGARPMEAFVPTNAAADEKLLRDWEQKSAELSTLVVAFRRVDTMKGWEPEYFEGHAFLQSPNLACLHFQKVKHVPGKAETKTDHERIVVTGQEVRQYDYATKEIFVFPLDRNQRNRALQEGPLPFLFNMKAAEAKQRYFMTIRKEARDAYELEVIPRLEQDRQVFNRALLQLNKTTFLPDRLVLIAPNDKDTQDYTFSDIRANQAIDKKFFTPFKINNWTVRENPAPGQPMARPEPGQGGRPPVGSTPRTRN